MYGPGEIVTQGELLAALVPKGGHFLWIVPLLFISGAQTHFTGVYHTSKAGGEKHEAGEYHQFRGIKCSKVRKSRKNKELYFFTF